MAKVKAVHTVKKGTKEIKPGQLFESSGKELEYLMSIGAVVLAEEPAPFVDVTSDDEKPTRKKPGPKPGAKKTGAKKAPAKKTDAKGGEAGKDSKPADTKETDDDLTG